MGRKWPPLPDSVPWLEEALRRFPELEEMLRSESKFEGMFRVGKDDVPDWWKECESVHDAPLMELAWREFDNPYMLWIELEYMFQEAWKRVPPNRDLIDRIYRFSDWCAEQPRGKTAEDDLLTCVCCCFLEHIPRIPAAMADMPNRFTWEQVEISREIFSYFVGEKGFEAIRNVYRNSKGEAGKILGKPRRRR